MPNLGRLLGPLSGAGMHPLGAQRQTQVPKVKILMFNIAADPVSSGPKGCPSCSWGLL